MKKYILLLAGIFALTLNFVYADQVKPWVDPVKFVFEAGGGVSLISMSEYNSDLEETVELFSGNSSINPINFGPGFDIAYASIFQSPIGLWAITAKFGMIFASNTDSKIIYSESKPQLEINDTLFTDYIGIGIRKYIGYMWEPDVPHAFVGLNGEIGSAAFHSFKRIYYDTSGEILGEFTTEPMGIFLGGSVEAGGDYWFSEYAGIFIKAGYRYLKGESVGVYSGTGIFDFMSGESSNIKLDYSGPFVNAGVAFSFDAVNNRDKSSVKSPGEVPQLPGEAAASLSYTDLVKYGNAEYGMKNYSGAAAYFETALKSGPNAVLFRKLGMSYYYLKNKEKAVENFEKYIEMTPSDSSMQKWLEKYR